MKFLKRFWRVDYFQLLMAKLVWESFAIATISKFCNFSCFDNYSNFYEINLDWKFPKTTFLSENIPNPFSEKTYFELNLTQSESVEIQITDISGKEISNSFQFFEKGKHQINLFRTDFPFSGIYFFHWKTSSENFTRKMLLINWLINSLPLERLGSFQVVSFFSFQNYFLSPQMIHWKGRKLPCFSKTFMELFDFHESLYICTKFGVNESQNKI